MIVRGLKAVALLLAVGVQPVLAQSIPGGHPRDTELRHLQRRAAYRADVQEGINEIMSEWGETLFSDEADEIGEFYTEDSVISAPGTVSTARGPDAMEEFLAELFPTAGTITTNWSDLDIGDPLVYAMGTYSYRPSAIVEGGPRSTRGIIVAIFRREGSDLRIRSQFFYSDSPPGAASP